MKAKNPIKARVPAPYNYHNVPVTHAKSTKKADRSIKVNQKNSAIEHDVLEGKRTTKLNQGPGFDEPFIDGDRMFRANLKGFKQAKTVTETGFVNNPVRQDIEEAWGRFSGQEQR